MPKKYIWNTKYTIQISIDRSQTKKCTQYNLHDTKSVHCLILIFYFILRERNIFIFRLVDLGFQPWPYAYQGLSGIIKENL